MEHLPFDPCQRKDRKVDHHDDQLPKDQGPARLSRGGKNFMHALGAGKHPAMMLLCVSQPANGVLDDNYRAINDDAEVQSTKAHQVCTHLVGEHARKGEEHRQRDHHRGDDRCTDIAEEQEEDGYHQDRPLNEVLLNRGDGLVHQISSVVNRDGDYPIRERTIDLFQLGGHCLRDTATVLADEHEHRAEHNFSAVLGGSSSTQLSANLHIRNMADPNGGPVDVADNDVGDVRRGGNLTGRPNQQLLSTTLDIASTDVGIVTLKCSDQVSQCELIGG